MKELNPVQRFAVLSSLCIVGLGLALALAIASLLVYCLRNGFTVNPFGLSMSKPFG